jgi:predicted O-methyltransferase YrrM
VVVADNVVRGGAVAHGRADDASVLGSRRLLEAMGSDPRLEATAIQTIGSEGHDGFAVAVVVS